MLIAFVVLYLLAADATVPSPLVGLLFAVFGVVMGSFIPREHAVPSHAAHGSHPQHKP